MHLAVYDAENTIDFLKAVKAACPFRITHILTDRGSRFTADAFETAGRDMSIDRRRTEAYSPQPNGVVERFNGRVADFTYIWTAEGRPYVAVVLDLFSRCAVGWSTKPAAGHIVLLN